ncbi:MAG: phage protease [Nitrincola lacisaponensis]|uniref:phage protease n=1 Tax=Nitrincola lacisaponensis TaxID=267850 RepID=UPI00391A39DF
MKTHTQILTSANSRQPITSKMGLAVLSSQGTEGMAILAMELSASDDGWHQLLPAGNFRAVDGRPLDVATGYWHLGAEAAAGLIALAQSATNDLVIDYEHQTLNADKNGQPAPAAGWFRDIEWREGSGLWIKPRWTERAKQFVKNGEYRYLSAVFPYDITTGQPLRLHSAALTNRPGIDGMQPLASLTATHTFNQEKSMNELLQNLLAQLGIEFDPATAALTEQQETEALAALKALAEKAGTVDTLATQVAALKAQDGGQPDPRKYVPIMVVTDLQAQLAVLTAESKTGQLDQLIQSAKDDGRLIPSMEEWARELGQKDMAALSAFLDKAAPIAALKATQTRHAPPEDKNNPTAALSAEELEVAKLLGQTPEAFAAAKAQ